MKHSPTKSLVIHYRQNNPLMSGAEIAQRVGISRQRVRQFLSRAGLKTTSTSYARRSRVCPKCGGPKDYEARTCHHCLPKPARRGLVICEECGASKERKLSAQRGKHDYCDKTCFGRYAGKHWGFGRKGQAQKS